MLLKRQRPRDSNNRPRARPESADRGSPRAGAEYEIWRDLVYSPEDLNLGLVEQQASMPRGRPRDIDDLVFDPADQTLKSAEECPERLTAWVWRAVSGTGQKASSWLRGVAPRRGAVFSIGIAVVSIFLGYLYWEPYHVETKLLFVDNDTAFAGKEKGGLPVQREIELLKNSEIMEFLAGDTYRRICEDRPRRAGNHPLQRSELDESAGQAAQWGFNNSEEFAKWLQRSLAFRSEISGGVGKITLSLTGASPDLLKTVMAAYVDGYGHHRRLLEMQGRSLSQGGPRGQSAANESDLPRPLYDQLQKIEMQQHGCQLALHFLQKGTGVFSGFVPDGNVTGITSLAQFQDRIVQLEIKKRALEVQFTPESREIRSLDLEIQGIKRAMRECLVEHIAFLKQGKERLLAQHVHAEADTGHAGNHRLVNDKALFKGDLSDGNAWFIIREGLYMLRDKPAVTKRPLLVKAGDLTHRLVAYFSPTGTGPAVATVSNDARPEAKPRASTYKDGQSERDASATEPRVSSGQPRSYREQPRSLPRAADARVSGKSTGSKRDYWECVPASHFGRKSLW